jgi:DNA polymerase
MVFVAPEDEFPSYEPIFEQMIRSRVRGSPLPLSDGGECWVTVHPSFLLRIPEPERKQEERGKFVNDLKRIRERAAELAR